MNSTAHVYIIVSSPLGSMQLRTFGCQIGVYCYHNNCIYVYTILTRHLLMHVYLDNSIWTTHSSGKYW